MKRDPHQTFGSALARLMESAEEKWPDQDPDLIFDAIGSLCETFDIAYTDTGLPWPKPSASPDGCLLLKWHKNPLLVRIQLLDNKALITYPKSPTHPEFQFSCAIDDLIGWNEFLRILTHYLQKPCPGK